MTDSSALAIRSQMGSCSTYLKCSFSSTLASTCALALWLFSEESMLPKYLLVLLVWQLPKE